MAPAMKKKPHFGKREPDRRPRMASPVERTFPGRAPDARRDERSDLIFGVLPVIEALRANSRRIDRIYVAEGAREKRLEEIYDLARAGGVRVDRVSRDVIERLVNPGSNHQGVVAIAASADYVTVEDILDETKNEAPLVVVLDGVEDPRNLGAVLRSVECAGADGVIIPERRAVGLTETVGKSSAGAIEHVKVAKTGNLNRLIEDLKARNIWVVGTSGEATMAYTEWDWRQPSAVVLGAEGTGLHRLVAENCDVLVKIPMYGKIDSLNVSVAAGIILFEARRQRSVRE
jgi:23S rRNA (guanosine2251-2'-O)-methyltransferase